MVTDNNGNDYRPQNIKKSDFTAKTALNDSDTLDFVQNGQNFKITKSDFVADIGTTGSLEQKGEITGTPVLNVDGTTNQIRNIVGDSGVLVSESPGGGVQVEHNFTFDSTGIPLSDDPTAASPTIKSLVQGSGISLATANGGIQIATSATPVTTKTVIINEESDFPTAVGGVITLEADTFYFITNDITTASRFALGSNTVVGGSDGTLITLNYTGSDTMFTSASNSNKIKDLNVVCASGDFIDISCATGVCIFQCVNCAITCDTIGTVDGMGFVRFFGNNWTVTTDGITFLNNNSIIGFIQNIGSLAAGTFVDLGTSTFDGFTFTDSEGTLSAGATFISGAANSANVNTNGLGTVLNTRAKGTGTSLSGITTSDALWDFRDNNGISDSRSTALSVCSGMTLTISSTDTPVKIDSNWAEQEAARFTTTTDGTFTYTGRGDFVSLTASVTAAGTGGTDDFTFYYFKNGVEITESGVQREFTSGDPGNISLVWADELETNDVIDIRGENNNDTSNITIVKVIMRFD